MFCSGLSAKADFVRRWFNTASFVQRFVRNLCFVLRFVRATCSVLRFVRHVIVFLDVPFAKACEMCSIEIWTLWHPMESFFGGLLTRSWGYTGCPMHRSTCTQVQPNYIVIFLWVVFVFFYDSKCCTECRCSQAMGLAMDGSTEVWPPVLPFFTWIAGLQGFPKRLGVCRRERNA